LTYIMARTRFMLIASVLLALNPLCAQKTEPRFEPAAYVNPFIGTDAHGHTYPGANMPFGMVQLSPDTRLTGWDGCSGYHYSDSVIYGFSHTHLSGTGVSDYGDILVMPTVGEHKLDNSEYSSPFKKQNENAEAGYYSVFLEKPGVLAELTVTTRVGFHRYTFEKESTPNILLDLEHRDEVLESWFRIISDTEIVGMRRSRAWAQNQHVYFVMQFSRPFTGFYSDNSGAEPIHIIPGSKGIDFTQIKASGKKLKASFRFEQDENPLLVKVALSAVSPEGAKKNLETELPGWDFDATRKQARETWNQYLSKIIAKGGTEEQLITFYTALYHCFLQPHTYMDVDGLYRGMDLKIHKAENFTNYTVFSLWDTYRTWHPLMTILDTRRTSDFIKTFLKMFDHGGMLPVWELAANETWCMIGYHSVSVIADAWMKGIRDFDEKKAFMAMANSARQNHFGLDAYMRYGHIPGDKEHESISKTLEYAYDDWCIAQMAKNMERDDIYREFIRRAQFYKNIFDPSTGFMRPKINGNWISPFDPTRVDWHFTEANSWQYSFYVPQDISGLISLHGGKEKLSALIDELFETESPITGRDMKDITGLIGQYAHGNEPSHHMAYLYNFTGEPWKTQQRVRQIMDEQYSHLPDGLAGNEDCGQMSAWLVMSAMGFYPVTPGKPEYIIGTPWFPEMIINLENGKTFTITADNVSKRNRYIQSAKLNNKPYTKSYLLHQDIINGGRLLFTMGSKPNKSWGSKTSDIPVTSIENELLLPVPLIIGGEPRFREPMEIRLEAITPGAKIFYSLDGHHPARFGQEYSAPFYIDQTTTVSAIAWTEAYGFSHITEAEFFKLDFDKSVKLLTTYHKSYTAGGPEALIDGIRGPINWRLGNWQGYQGTDFIAVVDLGSIKPINNISTGFLQDARSWIWMPVSVEYYISDDGQNFQKVADLKNHIPDDDYSVVIHDFESKVNIKARYVKVEARNYGIIPEWHPGARGQAYIFVDEIIIR